MANSRSNDITRRTLLKGVGVTMALPWLESIPTFGREADSAPPQRFAALTARPNVSYAGRVPQEAVPSYLAAADIGITPYTASPFNRASFPLKTLEYLGAGLPVVSTDLPGARWLLDDLARSDPAEQQMTGQIMTLAGTPADVVAAVRRMAGEPGGKPGGEPAGEPAGEQRADRCRAFAARHSWARRIMCSSRVHWRAATKTRLRWPTPPT